MYDNYNFLQNQVYESLGYDSVDIPCIWHEKFIIVWTRPIYQPLFGLFFCYRIYNTGFVNISFMNENDQNTMYYH